MKRFLVALLCASILGCVAGCNSSPASSGFGVVVSVSGSFPFVEAGGAPVTLTASVSGDSGNQGVTWALSQANTSCSPACGTLKASAGSMSAVYTPPASVPLNQQATITTRSNSDNRKAFVFNFQIIAAITVSINPKFNTQTAGGPAVGLTATVTNDPTSPPSGVSWTLTAGGTNCSPVCGTLTPGAAPSLSATYTPPAVAPAGANAQPTIAAASVADPTKSDNFSFTIVAPPIAVMILNKFSTQTVGGAAVGVNASVANDAANAGVTWALTSSGAACSPACGTITANPAPSFSASYTPPATAPAGANASPTIVATSVTDPTQSDSFTFNIVTLGSLFQGGYVFQLRGFDAIGAPMAMVGAITSDGAGNISGGELDLNDNFVVSNVTGLSGTYTVDNSFNGIARVSISITGGATTVGLKGALSSDGTRARIIQYDNSLALTAGTMLKQDPAALTGANVAGNYAFGLDSDAGTSVLNGVTTTGRIVEAGQFTIGAGGTSITSGVADAAQAQQPTFLAGDGNGPATIAAGPATAPDTSGRGTFTLSLAFNGNTYTTNYAYYVVSGQQLDVIEADSGGSLLTLQSGTAQRQAALTANSINATSVVALTGTAPLNGATSTAAIIGTLSVSSGSASVNYEINSAGNVNPGQAPVITTGSVFTPLDPTTGRALLLNTFFTSAAVYLYDAGKGFLIDITSGTSHAYSGPLIPQAAGPFSEASDIAGNYIAAAGGSSSPSIPNLDIAANFDNAGGYTTTVDFTNSNLGVGSNGQAQNASLSGAYVLSDTTVGWGKMSFASGVFGDFSSGNATYASFYLIGPRQFVAIGQGPLGNGSDSSGILFFDPQ